MLHYNHSLRLLTHSVACGSQCYQKTTTACTRMVVQRQLGRPVRERAHVTHGKKAPRMGSRQLCPHRRSAPCASCTLHTPHDAAKAVTPSPKATMPAMVPYAALRSATAAWRLASACCSGDSAARRSAAGCSPACARLPLAARDTVDVYRESDGGGRAPAASGGADARAVRQLCRVDSDSSEGTSSAAEPSRNCRTALASSASGSGGRPARWRLHPYRRVTARWNRVQKYIYPTRAHGISQNDLDCAIRHAPAKLAFWPWRHTAPKCDVWLRWEHPSWQMLAEPPSTQATRRPGTAVAPSRRQRRGNLL